MPVTQDQKRMLKLIIADEMEFEETDDIKAVLLSLLQDIEREKLDQDAQKMPNKTSTDQKIPRLGRNGDDFYL